MNPEIFRTIVGAYLRAVNVAQTALAHELGLHPMVLSHKLNDKDGARLTRLEVKKIVQFLAQTEVINTRSEAIKLLTALDLKVTSFTPHEWQIVPLHHLEIKTRWWQLKSSSLWLKSIQLRRLSLAVTVQQNILNGGNV